MKRDARDAPHGITRPPQVSALALWGANRRPFALVQKQIRLYFLANWSPSAWSRPGAGLQWIRSGSAKQVMKRKLFEPMLDLWGAKFRRPVCMACPESAIRSGAC
jgi:hypothetical protein